MSKPNDTQAPPIPNDREATWDLVIAKLQRKRDQLAAGPEDLPWDALHPQVKNCDELLVLMRERDQLGVERYGTRLQAHNGRDSLKDAIDECLDLCVYLANVQIETGDLGVGMMADEAIHLGLRMVELRRKVKGT